MSEPPVRAVSPVRFVRLQPRAPLVVRDARPFVADPGARAVSLEWPLPQTIAGAMRSCIGDAVGLDWQRDGPAIVRDVGVHGPLLVGQRASGEGWECYLPAPRDALLFGGGADGLQCQALRPVGVLAAGAGSNLPPGLRPLSVPADVKPDVSTAYWSLADQVAWLSHPIPAGPPHDWLGHLPQEVRVHVALDQDSRRAREGALFSTAGLVFADAPYQRDSSDLSHRRMAAPAALAMLCRVIGAPASWIAAAGLMPMAGERRLTMIAPAPEDEWPVIPAELEDAVTGARHLRLQLVTPALFSAGGWRPDWLDPDSLRGSLPGLPDITLQLVGAAVGRRIPVSGWDLQRHAPKAVRYAVPSGSVYFFDIVTGSLGPAHFASLWLQPIVSDVQDQRDGFGLAVPGVW